MIRALEDDDAIAVGHRACDAERRHDGLGAGVTERDPLVAGQFAEQLGDLARELRLRPDREAEPQLRGDGVDDEVRGVTERRLAEAVEDVDVFVAVDVPDARSLGLDAGDGIDHLLPLAAKPGGDARVGEHAAIALRQRLRLRGARDGARDQIVDVSALGGRHLGVRGRRHAERLDRRCRSRRGPFGGLLGRGERRYRRGRAARDVRGERGDRRKLVQELAKRDVRAEPRLHVRGEPAERERVEAEFEERRAAVGGGERFAREILEQRDQLRPDLAGVRLRLPPFMRRLGGCGRRRDGRG